MEKIQIAISLMRDYSHLLPKEAVVVDNIEANIGENKKAVVEMTEFLEKGDGDRISGEAVLKRSKRLGGRLGLGVAYTILNNPSVIPEDLRCFVLLFPGLVITIPVKGELKRCIPVLYPENGKYDLDFVWLGHESFGGGCLLVLILDLVE